MIKYDQLSRAQARWVDLLEILFPDFYKSDIITHSQLKMVHEQLLILREKDKKYKVSWPIWLITNNAVSRGVYKIPKPHMVTVDNDPDMNHPFYPEYIQELKQFNVIA